MILDEIKDLIKELENILIKDQRFKNSFDFKNQIKIIYKNKLNNNLNNNLNISQLPYIDVTPFISNLKTLNKPVEISKSQEINKPLQDNQNDCNVLLQQIIEKIKQIYKLSETKTEIKDEQIKKIISNFEKKYPMKDFFRLLDENPLELLNKINELEDSI